MKMKILTYGGNVQKKFWQVALVLALILSSFVTSSVSIQQAKATSNSVVIAEVFNGASQSEEWVTLANISNNPVNLNGWSLQDYSGAGNPQSAWQFPNVTIAPNSLLIVERSTNVSNAQAFGVDAIIGGSFNFSKTSDRLDLIDSSDNLVDGVAWGDNNSVEGFSITVPEEGFSSGTSLERLSRVDSDSDSDWAYQTAPEAGQWLSLKDTTSPVVLSRTPANGAVLTDSNLDVRAVFTLGQGIDSGTAELSVNDGMTETANTNSYSSLGNGEYVIELTNVSLASGVTYEAELAVTSTGGTVTSVWTFQLFEASGLVISEIYMDALDETNSEFVELYNPTNSDIDLSGYTFGNTSSAGNEYENGVIPNGTIIKAKGYFLIGDASVLSDGMGYWANPDIVVPLTVANDNGAYWIKDDSGNVVDRVSWGSNIYGEGTPFPSNPPVGASLERLANDGSNPLPGEAGEFSGNGWDTNNNAADFVIRTMPEPQNSNASTE